MPPAPAVLEAATDTRVALVQLVKLVLLVHRDPLENPACKARLDPQAWLDHPAFPGPRAIKAHQVSKAHSVLVERLDSKESKVLQANVAPRVNPVIMAPSVHQVPPEKKDPWAPLVPLERMALLVNKARMASLVLLVSEGQLALRALKGELE